MKIHEYQAKAVLKKYGVAVPRGEMVENREQAEAAAKLLFDSGASGAVVKAQIHAGGRGKGGGVKISKSVEEAGETRLEDAWHDADHASDRSGRTHRASFADRGDAAHRRELYLGIVLDRAEAKPCSWRRRPAAWRSSKSQRKIRMQF
jgi:succinyl-CoA synthetase beta subunit